MAGARAAARERTRAAILAAARQQIATHGGVGLSMRAVARESGLVSSAVYRYFETREALLTAMIVESYGNLDAALAAAADPPHGEYPANTWRALARALRGWGRAVPHEFQLLYGTPVPGYVAPPETIPAATAVGTHFLRSGAGRDVPGFDGADLRAQMADLAAEVGGVEPAGAAAVLAELAALVGFVTLELAGHFVGTADPADPLFDALVERQVVTLGLAAERSGTLPAEPPGDDSAPA